MKTTAIDPDGLEALLARTDFITPEKYSGEIGRNDVGYIVKRSPGGGVAVVERFVMQEHADG